MGKMFRIAKLEKFVKEETDHINGLLSELKGINSASRFPYINGKLDALKGVSRILEGEEND